MVKHTLKYHEAALPDFVTVTVCLQGTPTLVNFDCKLDVSRKRSTQLILRDEECLQQFIDFVRAGEVTERKHNLKVNVHEDFPRVKYDHRLKQPYIKYTDADGKIRSHHAPKLNTVLSDTRQACEYLIQYYNDHHVGEDDDPEDGDGDEEDAADDVLDALNTEA